MKIEDHWNIMFRAWPDLVDRHRQEQGSERNGNSGERCLLLNEQAYKRAMPSYRFVRAGKEAGASRSARTKNLLKNILS